MKIIPNRRLISSLKEFVDIVLHQNMTIFSFNRLDAVVYWHRSPSDNLVNSGHGPGMYCAMEQTSWNILMMYRSYNKIALLIHLLCEPLTITVGRPAVLRLCGPSDIFVVLRYRPSMRRHCKRHRLDFFIDFQVIERMRSFCNRHPQSVTTIPVHPSRVILFSTFWLPSGTSPYPPFDDLNHLH